MSDRTSRLPRHSLLRRVLMGAMVPSIVVLSGCNATEAIIYGGIGATLLGAHSPANEIEQVYYLGVFDPLEQVPESIYRITIHGQASAISNMKYGSGWVRAELIDSLQSRAGFQDVKNPRETPALKSSKNGKDDKGSKDDKAPDKGTTNASSDGDDDKDRNPGDLPYVEGAEIKTLATGRRLIMFGPEGFREAPKDHRLVVVMGASPEKFFRAVDESLGLVSQVRVEKRNSALVETLFKVMIEIKDERQQLSQLKTDIAKDMPESKGAQG